MNTQLDKPITMFSLLVDMPSRQVNENHAVVKPKIMRRHINKQSLDGGYHNQTLSLIDHNNSLK